MKHRLLTAAAAVVLALGIAGCSAGTTPAAETASAEPTPTTAALSGEITVFAAASLTATFTELAEQFEQANPGTTVTLTFGGSSGLVTQLTEGAPGDVFASADEANMTKAEDADLVTGTTVVFATNTLEIAVPPGNPANITDFDDLAAPGVRLVICAPEVPCGAATAKVATAAGVTLTPVSEESAVTDVLGKVVSGEADAGLVYRTDVTGAGSTVLGIAFPEADAVVNSYPISVLKGSSNPELAQAFVDYITSDAGTAVLTAAGFGTP